MRRLLSGAFVALALFVGYRWQHNMSSRPMPPAAAAISSVVPSAVRGPGLRIASGKRYASLPDRGDLVAYRGDTPALHSQAYTWKAIRLSEAHALHAIGNAMTVTAPDGHAIHLKYDHMVEHPDGNWTWVGRPVGGAPGIEAIITFGDRAVFGTIPDGRAPPLRLMSAAGKTWMVQTTPGFTASLAGANARDADGLLAPRSQDENRGVRRTVVASAQAASVVSGNPLLDIVLGYTEGFAARLGGQSQANTRLANIVDIANQAYQNSGITGRLRLVATVQVAYSDSTDNRQALYDLTGNDCSSGSCVVRTVPAGLRPLRAAREQYGADLVSLVRNYDYATNGGCGTGWILGAGQTPIDSTSADYAFSVVSDSNGTGPGSFPSGSYICRDERLVHEVGHNLGSVHDRASAQGSNGVLDADEYGRFAYSFGYKTDSTHGNFYTVMSTADSGQTLYRIFSNPSVMSCGGRYCGGNDTADNARSMNQTMPTVAAFRATVVPVLVSKAANDVDGDGRSDLIAMNVSSGPVDSSDGAVSFQIMNGASVVRSSSMGYRVEAGQTRVATGDFNGDGKADLVWARISDRTLTMWVGNGQDFATRTSIRNYAPGWDVVGAGDVDGDGRSDLLLQNESGNAFAYWLMDGPRPTAYSDVFATPVGFTRVATGDFNGDGRLDIVWARPDNRSLVMWTGNGVGFDAIAMRTYAPGWEVSAAADVDGDGKSDLVMSNASAGLTAYWLMNGSTPTRYSDAFTVPVGYVRATMGDFNGDGKADLLWVNNFARNKLIWFGDGVAFSSVAAGAPARVFREDNRLMGSGPDGDVDGDGRSDLLLQNSSTGQVAYWLMNGATATLYSNLFSPDEGFVRSPSGDFNGDQKIDLLWAKPADRWLSLWMSIGQCTNPCFLGRVVPGYSEGWTIAASGDIDGDGRSDVLLENAGAGAMAYWTMNGPNPVRYSDVFASPAGYVRSATGDFNGDGRMDVLWSSPSDRTLVMWLATGSGFDVEPVGAHSPGWGVATAGDLDGDGRSELILQNASTGQLAYWVMSGATPVWYSGAFNVPPGYQRSATGDYNGDNKLDIVWSRNGDRSLIMWLGTGTNFAQVVVRDYSPGWAVVQP